MTSAAHDITRDELLDLAELAGWPRVVVSKRLTIVAEPGAWTRVVGMTTPADRAAILKSAGWTWWSAPLVATRAARERLKRWFDLGGPTLSRNAIERDVNAIGVPRAVVTAALRRMPPAVQHHVVHRVWLLAVPRGLGGWCWQAPPFPASALQLILLDAKADDEALWGAVGHEVAHAWLLATAPPSRVPSLRERRRKADLPVKLAREWGRADLAAVVIQREMRAGRRDEQQAAALCGAWGFHGIGADGDACAAAVRPAAMRWW